MASPYFDLRPDPRPLDVRVYDAMVDAEEPDEDDPLTLLRQEIQALYGELLDRRKRQEGANVIEECAGCEVLRRYGWIP